MIARPCELAALLLALPLTQAWAPTGFRATLWAPTARTAEDRRASLPRQRGSVAAASPVVDFDQEVAKAPAAAEDEAAAAPVAATFKLGDSGLSPEATEVLTALTEVIDPDLGADIVSLGFIKGLTVDAARGKVAFSVELTTPACPVKEQFRATCEDLVEKLPWVTAVAVTMTAQVLAAGKSAFETPTGLSQVANIIAVSSCKGGVGKSTTAVNLAYALSALGAKVGILDADIYGPSLPTMVHPDSDVVEFVGSEIKPLEAHGVKLMSFGYVNQQTAAMRGPMVMQLLNQFVSLTSWGQLDYLVLDMPPGTGDVQLTLTQILNITAAVVVTTPQRLSFVDVVKGIDLFDRVNVPSVAVVENMASFAVAPSLRPNDSAAWEALTLDFEGVLALADSELDAALEKHNEELDSDAANQDTDAAASLKSQKDGKGGADAGTKRAQLLAQVAKARALASKSEEVLVFGKGHRERLSNMWGIENTVQLPLDTDAAKAGDSGTPLVVAQPGHPLSLKFGELAAAVVREVSKIRYSGAGAHPTVRMDAAQGLLLVDEGLATHEEVNPRQLRLQCRCAACVEEMTGRPLLDPASVAADVAATDFGPVGNYALQVSWSDGHSSLYPYAAFLKSRANKTSRMPALTADDDFGR